MRVRMMAMCMVLGASSLGRLRRWRWARDPAAAGDDRVSGEGGGFAAEPD